VPEQVGANLSLLKEAQEEGIGSLREEPRQARLSHRERKITDIVALVPRVGMQTSACGNPGRTLVPLDEIRDPTNQRSHRGAHTSANPSGGAVNSESLPTAVEVTSMAPSATPTRTLVRIYTRCCIYSRCGIDRVFFNHHSRRRYNDGAANHEGLGNDGSRLLDNNRRSPVLVRPRITFAVAGDRQIGGHCRRGES
jgi:hypothetical protein